MKDENFDLSAWTTGLEGLSDDSKDWLSGQEGSKGNGEHNDSGFKQSKETGKVPEAVREHAVQAAMIVLDEVLDAVEKIPARLKDMDPKVTFTPDQFMTEGHYQKAVEVFLTFYHNLRDEHYVRSFYMLNELPGNDELLLGQNGVSSDLEGFKDVAKVLKNGRELYDNATKGYPALTEDQKQDPKSRDITESMLNDPSGKDLLFNYYLPDRIEAYRQAMELFTKMMSGDTEYADRVRALNEDHNNLVATKGQVLFATLYADAYDELETYFKDSLIK